MRQLQQLPVQGGVISGVPSLDRQTVLLGPRGAPVGRRVAREIERREFEPGGRLTPKLIAEVDYLAVGRNGERIFLTTEVGLLRLMRPPLMTI